MGLFLTRRSTTGLDLEASSKPNVCLLLIAFYLWHIYVWRSKDRSPGFWEDAFPCRTISPAHVVIYSNI